MVVVSAILMLAQPPRACGQPIPIADASFENVTQNVPNVFILLNGTPPPTSGQFANPGWSWARGGLNISVDLGLVNIDITTYPGVGQVGSGLSTDGANVGRFTYTSLTGGLLGLLHVQTFGTVSLTQTTTANVLANTRYSLALDIDRSTTASLLDNFTITLTDNGMPFGSASFGSLATLLDRPSGLDRVGIDFTTGSSVAGGNLGIVLSASLPVGVGTDVLDLLPNGTITFDSLSLTAVAVPEPGTIALMGLSTAVAVAWAVRRRKRKLQALESAFESVEAIH